MPNYTVKITNNEVANIEYLIKKRGAIPMMGGQTQITTVEQYLQNIIDSNVPQHTSQAKEMKNRERIKIAEEDADIKAAIEAKIAAKEAEELAAKKAEAEQKIADAEKELQDLGGAVTP